MTADESQSVRVNTTCLPQCCALTMLPPLVSLDEQLKFPQATRSNLSRYTHLPAAVPASATQCNLRILGNWDREGLQWTMRQRDRELYSVKSQGNIIRKIK